MDNQKKYFFATVLAGILYLGLAQISLSQAQISFTNGQFTSFTTAPGSTNGAGLDMPNFNPAYTTGAALTGWTNADYAFVFTGGNPGDITIQGQDGAFELAGPSANGGSINNGLTLPPGGGNVVAMDGAYEVGPLSQVVTGLVANQRYAVTFSWAAAEQYNYNTQTTESFSVALGGTGFTANGAIQGEL